MFSAPPTGGGILDLEIPSNDKNPIWLVPHVNFNVWTINIKNNVDYVSLFEYELRGQKKIFDAHITKKQIDSGDFSEEPELSTGKKLLIVRDLQEWTYRTDINDTKSYKRSDAILIKNGKAVNKPITPYNTTCF